MNTKLNSYIELIFTLGVVTTLVTITTVEASSRSGAQVRSGYGEHCNKTLRCKTQSWLSCDRETNTCQCTKPDEMMLDESTGKCVVLIGERCKYGLESDEDDDSHNGQGHTNWYEKAECVEGAVCGPSGLCSCPKGFYEDVNKCLPVKSFGELCLSNQECDAEKLLSCVSGQCICDPNIAIYNNQSFQAERSNSEYYQYGSRSYTVSAGSCIGRVGTDCAISLSKYCVLNSYCNDGICTCKSQFIETTEKLCGLNYGSTCSESNICSDKFLCSTDFFRKLTQQNSQDSSTQYDEIVSCNCPHPNYQEYDSELKVCRGPVGAPCIPSDSTGCIDNAVCLGRDAMYQCECRQGYVQTPEGKCEIEYGQPCTRTELPFPAAMMCDQLADLICKSGKCGCKDNIDIYEGNRRQCSVPAGLRCKETSQCVQNSVCAKELNEKLVWGRCTCKTGYEVAKNHTCVLAVIKEDNNSSSEEDVQQAILLTEKSVETTQKPSTYQKIL